MKLLSLVILLSSIIFTFNYVWINRIDIINQNASGSVLLNKWTGSHCVFFKDKFTREFYETEDNFKLCSYNENGKIEFP
jgi:hypothetical protein